MKRAFLLLLIAAMLLTGACTVRIGPFTLNLPRGCAGADVMDGDVTPRVDEDPEAASAGEPFRYYEAYEADVTPLLLEAEQYASGGTAPRIYDAHMENAYFAVVRDGGVIRFLVYLAPWRDEIYRSESVRAEVTGVQVQEDGLTICSVTLYVTEHWSDGDVTTPCYCFAELDADDRLIRVLGCNMEDFESVEYRYEDGFVSSMALTDTDGWTERIGYSYQYDDETNMLEAVSIDDGEYTEYTVEFSSSSRTVHGGSVSTTYETDSSGRVIRTVIEGGTTDAITAEYVVEGGTRRVSYMYYKYYDGSETETWYEEHGYPTLSRSMEDGATYREYTTTYTWSGDTFTRLVERRDYDVSLITEGLSAGHLLLGGTVGPIPPAGKENVTEVSSFYEYVYDLEGRPLTLRWWTDLEDTILEEYHFDEFHDDEGYALDNEAPGNMNMQRYWEF